MTDNLKPCPMCGKHESVRLTTSHEAWDDEGIYADSHVVVCDASSRWGVKELGGCGTSGPCAETQEQAIAAWNRRTEPAGSAEPTDPQTELTMLRAQRYDETHGITATLRNDRIEELERQLGVESAGSAGKVELPLLPKAHRFVHGYSASDMHDYARAAMSTQSTHQPDVSIKAGEIDMTEALTDLVDCTSMLMEWCVKNVDKWDFPQYDWTARSVEKARALLAAKGGE